MEHLEKLHKELAERNKALDAKDGLLIALPKVNENLTTMIRIQEMMIEILNTK